MLRRKNIISTIIPRRWQPKPTTSFLMRLIGATELRFANVVLYSFLFCFFFQCLSVLVMNRLRLVGFGVVLLSVLLLERLLFRDAPSQTFAEDGSDVDVEKYFWYQFVFGSVGILSRVGLPLSPFVFSTLGNVGLCWWLYLTLTLNPQRHWRSGAGDPSSISLTVTVALSSAICLVIGYKVVGSSVDITLFTRKWRWYSVGVGVFVLLLCIATYLAGVVLRRNRRNEAEFDDDESDIQRDIPCVWYDNAELDHWDAAPIVFGIFAHLYIFHFMFNSPILLSYYARSLDYTMIVWLEVASLFAYNLLATFRPKMFGYLRPWIVFLFNVGTICVFVFWNVHRFMHPFTLCAFLIPLFVCNFQLLTHEILRARWGLRRANLRFLFWSLVTLYGIILLKIKIEKNYLYVIPLASIVVGVSRLRLGSFVYFNDGHDALVVHAGDGFRNTKLKLLANVIAVLVFILFFFNSSTYPKIRSRILDTISVIHLSTDESLTTLAEEGSLGRFDIVVIRNVLMTAETDYRDSLTYYADRFDFYLDYQEFEESVFVAVLAKHPIIATRIVDNFVLHQFALFGNRYLTALFELHDESRSSDELHRVSLPILQQFHKKDNDRLVYFDHAFSFYRGISDDQPTRIEGDRLELVLHSGRR